MAISDPYGTRIQGPTIDKLTTDNQSDVKSDALADEARLIEAFRQLSAADQKRLVEQAESITNSCHG